MARDSKLDFAYMGLTDCGEYTATPGAGMATPLEAENATLRGLIEERVKEWDWFTQPGSAGEDCTDPLVERMRAAIGPKKTEIGG